jgi:AraC family transcriptional regulator
MGKRIHIKNMVCERCIRSVSGVLDELNIRYENILLGEVVLSESISTDIKEKLSKKLKEEGFELIDDRRSRIISEIKKLIIEYVQELDYSSDKIYLQEFFKDKLNSDYSYLSNLFSSVEGQTIENYLIAQKVERAKELLVYNELTLSEIAHKLGYSSTAHLSSQFKKITGLTPTHFKSIGAEKRLPLDKI